MSTGDEHPTAPIALPLLQPDPRRAARVRERAAASFERGRHRSRSTHRPVFIRQVLTPLVVAISLVCLAELMNIAMRTLAL